MFIQEKFISSYFKKNSKDIDWNNILEEVHSKIFHARIFCGENDLICCLDLTNNGEKGFFDLFTKTKDKNFFTDKQKGYCFYNLPKIPKKHFDDQTKTEQTDIINLIFSYLFLNSSNKRIKSIFFYLI